MRQIDGYPLWIGNARDARDLKRLHEVGIEAVVDLAADEPPAVLSRDLVYQRFPLLDGDGNPPWLLRAALNAVAELIGARAWTLVACSGGMSRSPVVAAYAVARHDRRPADMLLDEWREQGPLDVSGALHFSLRRRSAGVTPVGRERAIEIAQEYVAANGLARQPYRFKDCLPFDDGWPTWVVYFEESPRSGDEVIHPEDGPIVIVDTVGGRARNLCLL